MFTCVALNVGIAELVLIAVVGMVVFTAVLLIEDAVRLKSAVVDEIMQLEMVLLLELYRFMPFVAFDDMMSDVK